MFYLPSMMEATQMALRARRMIAIRHLGHAVAAYYEMSALDVLEDAARFAGERALIDIPGQMQKPVVDYLCGRLLLPDPPRPSR
jgi:hypothetical protein